MNEIKLLTGEEFDVQIVMRDNEPWFVASHVAKVIDAGNPAMLVSGLDDCEKLVSKLFISGQNREIILVSEPGLYKMLMRSTKPKAKPFQDWLAYEVLPSIRKTGSYQQIPQTFAQALRLAADLQEKIELQAPKVQAFEALMDSQGNYSMSAAAKILGTGRSRLFKKLREHKMIRLTTTEPYQHYIDIGIFIVKTTTINDKARIQPFITPKGLERIRQIMEVYA